MIFPCSQRSSLSTCATCAALHDSSVKPRPKLKVRVDYAHTHDRRVADILVNINFYLGIYLSPCLDDPILNGDAR